MGSYKRQNSFYAIIQIYINYENVTQQLVVETYFGLKTLLHAKKLVLTKNMYIKHTQIIFLILFEFKHVIDIFFKEFN